MVGWGLGMNPWHRRLLTTLLTVVGLAIAWEIAPLSWLQTHWLRSAAIAVFLCAFTLPIWLAPSLSAASLGKVTDDAERIRLEGDHRKLQNDIRTALLQGIAGAAVIASVIVAWHQLENGREESRRQLALATQTQNLATQAQVAERLTRAVDQLASSKLDVELGGIYGLESIAQQQPLVDRLQVLEILSAYVREHSHLKPTGRSTAPLLQERQADVQAAMTVLGRRAALSSDPRTDLGGSLLQGARLGGAKLQRVDFGGANLRGAYLRGSHLENALLCGADLRGADLADVHLKGAHARGTMWPPGFKWHAAGATLGPCD